MFLISMMFAICFYVAMFTMLVSFDYLRNGTFLPAFIVGLVSVLFFTMIVIGVMYFGVALMLIPGTGAPVFNI